MQAFYRLFCNELNKFNKTGELLLDSFSPYDTIILRNINIILDFAMAIKVGPCREKACLPGF